MKPKNQTMWTYFIKSLPLTALVVLVAMALTAVGVLAATGTTDSAAAPGSTSSYTLESLYQRLMNSTAGTQSTFTEPSVAPGTGTMHDINALMAAAPMRDDANGATTADVLPGTTFWGLTNGEWGLQTGSMTLGSDVTGADGLLSFSIPDGYYSGNTAAAADANLSPENIKYGETIFGVTGTYFQRFQENGDGTVTDTFTDLIWTQDANAGESTWNNAFNYCDTLAFAGASDWRLPEYTELQELMTLPDGISSTSPQMFTDLQSAHYWSNTFSHTAGGIPYYYIVGMETGGLAIDDALFTRFYWCVRND